MAENYSKEWLSCFDLIQAVQKVQMRVAREIDERRRIY